MAGGSTEHFVEGPGSPSGVNRSAEQGWDQGSGALVGCSGCTGRGHGYDGVEGSEAGKTRQVAITMSSTHPPRRTP